MNQEIKIKRGLVRLFRTTVEELAEFARAKPETVCNFLNTPGLCRRQYFPASGRVGRRTIWELTDAGREKLLADLRRFSANNDPELDKERLDGLRRIQQGITELEQEVGELESSSHPDDDLSAVETRIRERLSTLGGGLRNLRAWRAQPIDDWRVTNLRARLDELSL